MEVNSSPNGSFVFDNFKTKSENILNTEQTIQLKGWQRGFVCAYHPAAPSLNPIHTIYAFYNLYD